MRKVRVELGKESYDIYISHGLQQELVDFVKGAGFSKQAMLVTDSNVGPLYGEKIRRLLEEGGLKATIATIPAGESSKSLRMAGIVAIVALRPPSSSRRRIFSP